VGTAEVVVALVAVGDLAGSAEVVRAVAEQAAAGNAQRDSYDS
jgi:hypothetical protein